MIESDEDELLITGTDHSIPEAEILKLLTATALELKQKSAKTMIDTLATKREKIDKDKNELDQKLMDEEWSFHI